MSDNFPPPPEQPQPEHRAPEGTLPAAGPSPWAAPATPPHQQRTGLIVTLAVGGALVVAGVVAALVHSTVSAVQDFVALPSERSDTSYSEPYEGEAYEEEPVESTPEPAAEGDVTITKCSRDSVIGWPHADLKIVNRTGSPAAYIVSITFVDGDGAVVADGIATTEDVAPGGSAKVRALGSGEVAADTKCRIGHVERHAL
ncbi:FxLYD domain-containing protein [Streptomyces sp. V2I9]|uniref:FxLYD domain-containing protein n=1 Tax=Streptomyces sp. V2I9 TaxID=3042304 RepID=UPI002783BAE5|nr:FxLYD domain-containing protein [Streptomyces sp. V2I9]MDQ0987721.1 hypothetical protein [Streptomyces sp. V2I9]